MIDLIENKLIDPSTITPSLAIEAISNSKDFQEMKDGIYAIEMESSELTVDNDAGEQSASALRSKILSTEKAIKSRVDFLTQPSKDWTKKASGLFKPHQDKLSIIDDAIEKKQLAYRRKVMEEQKKQEEANAKKIAAAVKKGKDIPDLPEVKVENTIRTEVGKTSYQTFWTFRISDASKIPIEFCTVDESKIRKAVKEGIRKIPGVEIFEDIGTKRG